MKKSLILIIAVLSLFAFCFAGCGGSSLPMATGGTTGTYYSYGAAAAQVISDNSDIKFDVQSTGASKANIRLIESGENDIAIVQNDVMNYAYKGIEIFEGEVVTSFSTMATLYNETIQIVVRADSGINSVADLKGKKVCVGDAGSGTEANTRQILAAYGLSFDDIQVQNMSFGDASTALQDNSIDASFVTAGAPTTAVMQLAATTKIKILSLSDEVIDSLMKDYPFYVKEVIPANTYTGFAEDATTVAVKATFIVSNDLSEETVYNMTKALIENRAALASAHVKGEFLTIESAVQGNADVPFHPGAIKYYKEIGAMK